MVAATICAACTASGRTASRTTITAISAMLNSSGENAVSAKRPCAFNSAIITVTGPAKARYGSIRRALSVASCSVSRPENPGASAVNDERHRQREHRCGCDQRCCHRAEHAAGERRRGHSPIGFTHPQPCRHQRRVQPALGQQPPDDIDQLKRRQERIRDGARAEQRGKRRIAHESKQPRGQRSRGYREEGADHWRFYSSMTPESGLPVFAQGVDARPQTSGCARPQKRHPGSPLPLLARGRSGRPQPS